MKPRPPILLILAAEPVRQPWRFGGRRPRLVLLLLLLLCPPLPAPTTVHSSSGPFFSTFAREKAVYQLTFKGIGAAEASIIYLQGDTGTIKARIDTKVLTGLIFSIHNTYEADVDPAAGLPWEVRKEIAQSNLRQSLKISYDRAANAASGNNGASWHIQPGAMDLFTMLFRLRIHSPRPGDRFSFPLDIESQNWTASGEAFKGEEIKGPLGLLETRKIIFHFSRGSAPAARTWKTDLLTNRIARPDGQLTIFIGPPPENIPLLLQFGPPGSRSPCA